MNLLSDEERHLARKAAQRTYRFSEKGRAVAKRAVKKYQESEKGQRALLKGQLRHHYGMTVAQFEKLMADQNGVCAICGGDNLNQRLCVDHDHFSGRVRGLLCQKCNAMVGYSRDSIRLLYLAADYLEFHSRGRI